MLDINLNFFFKCFRRKGERRLKSDSIEILRQNICTMKPDMKLRYILQKILNGTFDILFLNSINGKEQKNVMTLGTYDHLKVARLNCSFIIPIFIENELKYSLVLCSYKSVINNYNKGLVKLLTEVLGCISA